METKISLVSLGKELPALVLYYNLGKLGLKKGVKTAPLATW